LLLAPCSPLSAFAPGLLFLIPYFLFIIYYFFYFIYPPFLSRGTSPGDIEIISFSNIIITGTQGVFTVHPTIAFNLNNEYGIRDRFGKTVFIPFLEYKKRTC
jgi:hypothetical protein